MSTNDTPSSPPADKQNDSDESTLTGDATQLLPSPDHAWKALAVITDWIKHAEAKAGATLAASGLVGTALYNITKDVKTTPCVVSLFMGLTTALVLLAAIFAAVALRPRLWTRDEPTSTLYFHHIARKHGRGNGGAAYASALSELTANSDQLVAEIAGQIWANAHVARTKYTWGSLGLTCILLSILPLAATAITASWYR